MATLKSTLKQKMEQEVSSKKISPEMKEFVQRIDHLRTIVIHSNTSFSQTLLNTRKGK